MDGLAVMMRRMQWSLDEAAFRLGAGDLGVAELAEIEGALRSLADSVRDRIDREPTVIVIDTRAVDSSGRGHHPQPPG